MEYHMKLPRNGKEGILFTLIIVILSVNIIGPVITFFEAGFSLQVWGNFYQHAPILFVVVLACVVITHKPAALLKSLVAKKEDSFSANIMLETLCTVVFMSMLLTILGSWVGMGKISFAPFHTYFEKWPRNFGVALFVETFLAQPIARFVMLKMHEAKDKKVATN